MNPTFNFPGDSFVFTPTYVPPSAPQPQYGEDPLAQPPPYLQHPIYDNPIDPALSFHPPPESFPQPTSSPSTGFRIKLPPFNPMAPMTRGASRLQPSSPIASGSEYHESNASMEAEEPQPEEEEEEPVEYGVSSRGRRVAKKSYRESGSEDDPLDVISPKGKGKELAPDADDEDDEDEAPVGGRYALRRSSRGRSKLNGFVVTDDEDDGEAKVGGYATRNRTRNGNSQSNGSGGGRLTRRSSGRSRTQASSSRPKRLSTRHTRSSVRNDEDEDGYVDEPSSGTADGEGSIDEAPVTSPEPEPDADGDADAEGDVDQEQEQDGKPYSLRQRAKINYAIPPPLEEMRPPPKPRPGGSRSHRPNRPKPPGWSATGAELSRWMGGGGDDSVRLHSQCMLFSCANYDSGL